MALITADRVFESTTTTGTSDLTLAGAVTGYRTFGSVLAISDTCYYTLWESDNNGVPTGAWETGLGTFAASSVLQRTTVHASSTGSKLNLSSGQKRVALATTATAISGLQPALSAGFGDTLNPYASKTANYILAAPSGSAGTPSFRALTSTDIPALSYLSATGADTVITRYMLKDSGISFYDSTTTNALDYTNGSCQRWAPNTGAQTLSITNWPPTDNLGELLIQGINLGAATITWPTINWIKSDGTTTTTFSSNGVTLQTSGTDWVFLWTRDAGTTIYGKVVR